MSCSSFRPTGGNSLTGAMSYVCFPTDTDFNCQSDTASCDPNLEFCDFMTPFSVDFGDSNTILDDSSAQSIFSIITRDWINACNENNGNNGSQEVYYGFYFDKSSTKKGRMGQAGGKCRGRDCPKPVSFSAPSVRKNPNKSSGQDKKACERNLLEALKSEDPVFSKLVEIRMDIPNEIVLYGAEIECKTAFCSSMQRNASKAVLHGFGLNTDDMHECLWEGIVCDEDKNIASIRLPGKCFTMAMC